MPFDTLADHESRPRAKVRAAHGTPIRCAACGAAVSDARERIECAGAHAHRFTNPHGLAFEIGCFAGAEGCTAVGAPTTEWTWFAGHAWQVALCRGCGTHLGWRFRPAGASTGPGFHGLILDRLASTS